MSLSSSMSQCLARLPVICITRCSEVHESSHQLPHSAKDRDVPQIILSVATIGDSAYRRAFGRQAQVVLY